VDFSAFPYLITVPFRKKNLYCWLTQTQSASFGLRGVETDGFCHTNYVATLSVPAKGHRMIVAVL
jgi:hypothetical protein